MGCVGKTVEQINGDYSGLDARVTVVEADILTVGFTTGDIKPIMGVLETGWIEASEAKTIGDTSSSADYAGATYKDLYDVLWDLAEETDNVFIISVAKGADSDADWAAGKTIAINVVDFLRYENTATPGRKFADQMQGHKHSSSQNVYSYNGVGGQDISAGTHALPASELSTILNGIVTDGTNGTPRTGDETFPKHSKFKGQIKL